LKYWLVLAYGLNASTWICFLWFEDTSHGYASPLVPCFLLLLTCHVVYILHLVFFCLGSALEGISFLSLGTLVLLLHVIFGVKFVQHMTSFHWRFWPFLALLFFWISSLILDIISLSFLCFCQVVCLVVKRYALIGFVDDCFYRMVVKRWFDVFSFKQFNLELWLLLVG